MKVAISTSSSKEIGKKYDNIIISLLNYLVTINDIELCWGSCSSSLMGLCYNTFEKANKSIYGYTTPKYVDDLINLKKANHKILQTTFDLRKQMFYDADVIICLPGGTGTIAEFFAYLEEIRSNDVSKLLILYNEDNFFDNLLDIIDDLVKKHFSSENIYNYFKVVNNLEDFKKILCKVAIK